MTHTIQVPSVEFDHHSRDFALDPFGTIRKLREQGPVLWSTTYGGFWVVTSHDLVSQAYRDFRNFSSVGGISIPPLSFGTTHIPTTIDPPLHGIYRSMLNPWFSADAIAALEPEISRCVREIVSGLRDKGSWNFYTDLAAVVPGTMALSILGIRADRRSDFLDVLERGYSNQATTDAQMRDQLAADSLWLKAQIAEEIALRHENPGNDLISAMVTEPLKDGRVLTDQQITDTIMVIVLAGFHTTAAALSSLLIHLQRHPEQRTLLRERPEVIPAAIDEIVRVYSPAVGFARHVTQDLELGGVRMAKGDMAMLLLMAAGSDPNAYEAPNTVDFERDNRRSVAFGTGPHRCLGFHLAQAILRIEIQTILEMMPEFEIDLDAVEVTHSMAVGFGFESVPARLPK